MRRISIFVGGLALASAWFSCPQLGAADAPAWMHAVANAPLPAYDEKTNAVLVYSEDVTTVMPDGKTKAIERRAYKILRPEGREYAAAHAVVGRDTKLGSMRAWCIPKQGKDYEVKDKDAMERSLGIQGGELISDLKVRTLEIPAAEAGNVVGYEIEYQSRPYVLEDWWWIQRDIPVREARYTLQLPTGWEYKAVWINHSAAEATASGNNQWSWVVSDLPAILPERRMPPLRGLAAQMIVSFLAPGTGQRSGFLTWNDMGQWLAELARGRRDTTPQINQRVAELTKERTTPQQKMSPIAGFVQREIRYVGIELGIGGWQPHGAADVFVHRYGDCKDKATLMSAMLQQAGIDSYYVFINTLRGAVGPQTPPMMFLFNHVILAIKLPESINDPRYQAILDHLRASFPDADIAHAFASTEAGVAFDVRDGLSGFPASYIEQRGDVEVRVVDQALRIRSGRVALGYLGLQPAQGVYVVLARIFALIYFLYFIGMPFYTYFEKVKAVPERLTYHAH